MKYCVLFWYPFPDSGLRSWHPNLTNVFPVLRKVMIHYSEILTQLSCYINVERWSNYIHKILQNFILFGFRFCVRFSEIILRYVFLEFDSECVTFVSFWLIINTGSNELVLPHHTRGQWLHYLYLSANLYSCWQPQYFLQLQKGRKICALKICGLILKSCWAYSWWAMLSVVIHPTTCVSSRSIELSCSYPC